MSCPRCRGLVVVDLTERRFQESFCLACGYRAYEDTPWRPGRGALREPQEALDLPAVPFKAYNVWLRRYKGTFSSWRTFTAYLLANGYQLERPLVPFGAELRPGPLMALRGGGN
ncbi:MAG: hypothetical protein HY535_04315 [Chloroflexi bacterium]|nr:hypothetical protein [Chloroflexota bacterium]